MLFFIIIIEILLRSLLLENVNACFVKSGIAFEEKYAKNKFIERHNQKYLCTYIFINFAYVYKKKKRL